MLKNVDELKKFNIKSNEKYALNEIIKSFNDEDKWFIDITWSLG